jgi:hypothetical protein
VIHLPKKFAKTLTSLYVLFLKKLKLLLRNSVKTSVPIPTQVLATAAVVSRQSDVTQSQDRLPITILLSSDSSLQILYLP